MHNTFLNTNCTVCHKPIHATPSHLKRNKNHFCSMECYRAWQPGSKVDLVAVFWSRVKKTRTCWLWTGTIGPNRYGYLSVRLDGQRTHVAHRICARLLGISLYGKECHHVCLVKRCIRFHAKHIIVVPRQSNPDSVGYLNRIKEVCPRGHSYSGENLKLRATGGRRCRKCMKIHDRRAKAKRKRLQR